LYKFYFAAFVMGWHGRTVVGHQTSITVYTSLTADQRAAA